MNGKQLKNSILQWAIQGKLVPQDPNDEPASVLLERIRAEKARLVKEGKIKKDKNESIIYKGDDNSYYEKFPDGKVVCVDEEIPFGIPEGWEWARLNVSVSMNPRNTAADDLDAGFIPMTYIDPDLSNTFKFDMRKWKTIKSGFTHLADGDVAFAKITPCITNLKAAVMRGLPNGIAAGTTELNVFRCYKGTIIAEYILYYLATPYILVDAVYKGTAGQQRIMTQYLASRLLPIPPYKEQQRIVDKIKALLPVIQKYNHAQNAVNTLNEEIYSLLQKSILQEAIQGKLVPQVPSDEPAQALLERIATEKQQLVKEGKLKAKDAVSSIIFKGDDNKYYEQIGDSIEPIDTELLFPETWAVCKLSTICQLTDGIKRTGPGVCLDAKYLRGKSAATILQNGKYVRTGDNIILVDGENSGEVFAVPENGYMGSTFKQLWISGAMCKAYVLHTIRFYKDTLRNSKKGAAIPHLNKDLFYNIFIGIPPFQEQERIAARIDELQALLN